MYKPNCETAEPKTPQELRVDEILKQLNEHINIPIINSFLTGEEITRVEQIWADAKDTLSYFEAFFIFMLNKKEFVCEDVGFDFNESSSGYWPHTVGEDILDESEDIPF